MSNPGPTEITVSCSVLCGRCGAVFNWLRDAVIGKLGICWCGAICGIRVHDGIRNRHGYLIQITNDDPPDNHSESGWAIYPASEGLTYINTSEVGDAFVVYSDN